MSPGLGPRAAVYVEITAPSCLPPITGQEELFAGALYLPFAVAQLPPETMVLSSVQTYHKTPIISWHDGFQEKGEPQTAAQGILTRGRLRSENPGSSGVRDSLRYCNESPLVQCPPTICL